MNEAKGAGMNPLYEEALHRVLNYRVRNQLSQEDMGKLMGVTQSHYCKLEQGKKVISGEALLHLNEMKVDVDFFITGEETLETELNTYIQRYPEHAAEIVQIMVWLVNRGISMMDKVQEWGTVDYQKEMELLHLKEWNNLARERVWYGIRKVNDLTQVEMSKLLDVNIKKYREIEKVSRIPDAEVLTNLYDKTGVTPSFLFPGLQNNINILNRTWKNFSPEVKHDLLKVLDEAVALF